MDLGNGGVGNFVLAVKQGCFLVHLRKYECIEMMLIHHIVKDMKIFRSDLGELG